jgi:bifunctional non-homologous end joining protein LigD
VNWREDPAKVRPMLATPAEPPLTGAGLVFEPKYDGIRALVHVEPRRGGADVHLWSRLGNEKTSQFPSIVSALQSWGSGLRAPVLVDGEIVALDERGRPAGFQKLQGRIHLADARGVERLDKQQPVALILFDILRDGDEDVRGLALTDRRRRLEQRLTRTDDVLRISEQAAGDGRALHARALSEGWEGLIAKDLRAPYQSGRRSPAWRKLKVLNEQEFVIGGWTEPRQSRQYFGALLLGVPDESKGHRLRYVGHTGTGFDQKELARVWKLLDARSAKASPFSTSFKTNEPAHWVKPELVAQIRFTEWTADQKLRQPVYLGLRDDTRASEVVQEAARGRVIRRLKRASTTPAPSEPASFVESTDAVVAQLRALEDARRDGTIELPDGSKLGITNPHKIFWPALKLTKGDLLRYYATVAPFILPAVADRPLVMKRFPNGVDGPAFYQQRSRLEKPPAAVRIETVADDLDPISEPDARRFVGGSLITLLYMTQIAAISQDPWFSRIRSPLEADYVALDLDPGEGTPFSSVLDVARLVHDELASLAVPSVPKTSGSRGLHIYIPLAPGTSYESGMLFCQIIATVIAAKHPKLATVERTVRARRKGTVYVDFLQNILGKTLATAYRARASDYAGVSTPLTWKEIFDGLDPREFTIATAPARFAAVGDLWKPLRTSKPANLEAVFRKYK